MTYTPPNPPTVNGVASFALMYESDGVTPNPNYNATKVSTIKTALQSIQTAFTPSATQQVCDLFYIVSTYNKQNVGSEINGDTANAILTPTGV